MLCYTAVLCRECEVSGVSGGQGDASRIPRTRSHAMSVMEGPSLPTQAAMFRRTSALELLVSDRRVARVGSPRGGVTPPVTDRPNTSCSANTLERWGAEEEQGGGWGY